MPASSGVIVNTSSAMLFNTSVTYRETYGQLLMTYSLTDGSIANRVTLIAAISFASA